MRVTSKGRFSAVEALETPGGHLTVKLGPLRRDNADLGTDEQLRVVSVFVNELPDADVAVCVNGVWWQRPATET